MIELPESSDVEIRNELLKMTEKSLDADIKRMVKVLNTRLLRLEKSGLKNYATAATRVKEWMKENTPDATKRFKFSSTHGMSLKEKANYLTMLYHFEGYKLKISDVKATKEMMRKNIKKELGYAPSDEQMDRIGEAMGVLYRDNKGIDAIFSEIFTSEEARLWVVEHNDITEEQAERLLNAVHQLIEDDEEKVLTSQDIRDFIDDFDYKAEDDNTYEVNGIKVDRGTGLVVDKQTGELIEGLEYDSTSELLRNEKGFVANVDDNGVVVPILDFLRGKYGYI
jgi:hypothetical protein